MLSWQCNHCETVNLSDDANCVRCHASAFDGTILLEVETDEEPAPFADDASFDPGLNVSRRRFLLV